jgi:hypothetical protein
MGKLLIILAFIPVGLRASDPLQVKDTSAMKYLYSVIATKKPALSDNAFRWEHRRILYAALGLDPRQSDDSATFRRIRFGWRQLQAVRISQSTEPPFYFRDILRLALHHRYGAVLLDAVRWGVDVNSFDPSTHSSLMDYLEDEYRNGTDEQRIEWLREYKKILQGGGAAYFTETNFHMRQLAKNYDRIRPPVDGLFPVQRNGKWGWVNDHNVVVVPLKYKAVRNFTRQVFEVSKDGKRFYILEPLPREL